MRSRAVAGVRLVIAAARTERTRPTLVAVGLVGDVMFLEKSDLDQAVDTAGDGAEFVFVRASETMAESDVAIGGDAHQPESRAAGVRFADAFVDLFERIFDVRESVMAILDRGLQEVGGERLKLPQ